MLFGGCLTRVGLCPERSRLSAHAPLHLARGRLRFFGAVPLVSPDGECLGALCVCDVRERHMDTANLGVLSSFASMAMRHVVKEQQFRLAQQHHDEVSGCRGLPSNSTATHN